MPSRHTLPANGKLTYRVHSTPGTTVAIVATGVPADFGSVRLGATGPGGTVVAPETCQGYVTFAGQAADVTVTVAQCNPSSGGDVTTTLNVVSGGAGNCGRALACAATPDGIEFLVAGEADAFTRRLQAGQAAQLKLNYLRSASSSPGGAAPRVQLFDPNGTSVASSFNGTLNVTPSVTGVYTALVSAFGSATPKEQPYRIEFHDASCPLGPTITSFLLTDGATKPLKPIGYNAAGNPIYNQPFGSGGSLVIEARAGESHRSPGDSAVPNGDQDPDLQVIFSRNLGDGDPRICDVTAPFGGVPATIPFAFNDAQPTRDHVDDMGCRFINGQGVPIGRTSSSEACTPDSQGDFNFVDSGSGIQFCAQIALAWEFQEGDTTVDARIKDTRGTFGATREIVIRIGDGPTRTPTATPTPFPPTRTSARTDTPTPRQTDTPPFTAPATRTETRTRTPSRTRTITPTPGTPTATPTGPTPTVTATATPNDCPGDCDGNRMVSVAELTRLITIALGRADISACPAGDADGDGEITIDDLVRAVSSALNGCPAQTS